MDDIPHQGIAPEEADTSYQVFRNVKDFGAKGDGVTDDTEAIRDARQVPATRQLSLLHL
jgi:glucan 1,3-beta-glucosidase